MKKIILVSLCVLFVTSVPVFGYRVTGQVTDSGGAVSGATVYINCYMKDGTSHSDTQTTGLDGHYTGGWLATNCKGGTIDVKAVKGGESGSRTWQAGDGPDLLDVNKDITISAPPIATGELHCEPQPVAMGEPSTMVPSTCVLYKQMQMSGPINVNGGSATIHYDSTKMYCAAVEPNEPFTSLSYYVPTPGTLYVNAYTPSGSYVSVPNGVTPRPFFTPKWIAYDYNTAGTTSFFDVYTEISTDTGTINGFDVMVEIIIGEPNAKCKPYFRLDKEEDWTEALSSGHVYAMDANNWGCYMSQWKNCVVEGNSYPNDPFLPATLYVYGGGGGGGGGAHDPCDAGLVMYWGGPTTPDGNYSSAWKFDYLLDPDLSNCIITVTVTAPGWRIPKINKVSFGMQNSPNPGGPIRAWYWNCGAAGSGAPITWDTPTTITIDTSKTGTSAATPKATSYMNNGGFALNNVQWLIVDEDSNWVGGALQAPAPGTGWVGNWNYWHNLTISPKTTISKGYYTKWSQPPVIVDPNVKPPTILGWDERSECNDVYPHLVADDWECNDARPITAIHWWGSFISWNQPYLPPVMPQSFHIGIWTDDPCDYPGDFSHPGMLVWENYCTNYVWNFAGYDKDPRGPNSIEPNDSCFQFNQLLSQDQWFYQQPSGDSNHPRIYWLSIAPIWPNGVTIPYHWGWKTRPHYFNDDAAIVEGAMPWPPVVGSTTWSAGVPIHWPAWPGAGTSYDVAFELTTNEPGPSDQPSADFNNDGIVNFIDFATFAKQWLTPGY